MPANLNHLLKACGYRLMSGGKSILAVCLVTFLVVSNVFAQSTENTVEGEQNTLDPAVYQQLQAKVVEFLEKEKVVIPGVGFNSAKLGEGLNVILQRWGDPITARELGLLGKTTEILYHPDENTMVVFSGKEALEEITIKGQPGSYTRTFKGITFGMSKRQVRQLTFQDPKKEKKDRLTYPDLGINYFFEDNVLSKMVVFPPE